MAEDSLSTRRQFLKAAPPAIIFAASPVAIAAVEQPADFSAAVRYLVGEFWRFASALKSQSDFENYTKMLAMAKASLQLPCGEEAMKARAAMAEWRKPMGKHGCHLTLPYDLASELRGDAA